jgi:hypothetical protein
VPPNNIQLSNLSVQTLTEQNVHFLDEGMAVVSELQSCRQAEKLKTFVVNSRNMFYIYWCKMYEYVVIC